jgi:importin subunit beta-1
VGPLWWYSITNQAPAALLQQYVEPIFSLLNIVWLDQNRSDALMRASMGVIGWVDSPAFSSSNANHLSDLADAFPHGEFQAYYRADWLTQMIKDTRQNREFQPRTIETARWAREQVKRQIGGSQGIQQTWFPLSTIRHVQDYHF